MSRPPYFSVRDLVMKIDRPPGAREGCLAILDEHERLFKVSLGSPHNHQSWIGGYWDHVSEVMNLAALLFPTLMSAGRPVPFTLSDALLALFFHDLEKPWKYEIRKNELRVIESLVEKSHQHAFRLKRAGEFDVPLPDEVVNAIRYAEGEGDDFTSGKRVSNELAAFVHVCDTMSARIFHEHPLDRDDPWSGQRPSMRE